MSAAVKVRSRTSLPQLFSQWLQWPRVSASQFNAVLKQMDPILLGVATSLLLLGLIMVASSAVSITDDPLFYFKRQFMFALVGLLVFAAVLITPMEQWQSSSTGLLVAAFALLILVLLPGIGHEVNGSVRWIDLGIVRLQVSEPARLLLLLYLSGYLVRRADSMVQGYGGVMVPMLVLVFASLLLLLEPDFGAAVLLAATWMVMLFIGNVRLGWIVLFALLAAIAIAALAIFEPYRMARLLAFIDPWAGENEFGIGYQTAHAQMAIGRGGWFGVGLGESMQKLSFLPEAHTDFIFAVYAEEFGLLGAMGLLAAIIVVGWRGFVIASKAAQLNRWFAAYLTYGLTFWLVFQSLVHIAVNIGLLPPKGLTLPLISYGGSSLWVVLAVYALIFRVGYENSLGAVAKTTGKIPKRRRQPTKAAEHTARRSSSSLVAKERLR